MARKARKFQSQGRLALPVLELAYLFLGITHAPRAIVADKMLPQVNRLLAELKRHEMDPKQYEQGQGYYDDLCLARFLEGVCFRYIAYPVGKRLPTAQKCMLNYPQRIQMPLPTRTTTVRSLRLRQLSVLRPHLKLSSLMVRRSSWSIISYITRVSSPSNDGYSIFHT